jgi:hypothetical protein
MRYSNKEVCIIMAIADIQDTGKTTVHLDELVDVLKPTLDPKGAQVRFRSGLSACIRNLQRKLPRQGLKLESDEKVGRGNKSIFNIDGSYRGLVDAVCLNMM